MAFENLVKALTELGFTGLEAEVYVALLQESPATAYRVAQVLRRPAAGIYKTVDSLVSKGAVIVQEGETRLCRAVPGDELLAGLRRRFAERREAASRALAAQVRPPDDDRIYRFESSAQALERGRAMVQQARELVLLDAFPGPLEELRPELERAVARGVSVSVQAYGPFELPGARTSRFPPEHPLVATFPGGWAILAVDGREHLTVYVDSAGRLLYGAWSANPFFAFTLQSYMASEFAFVGLLSDPSLPLAARELARRHAVVDATAIPGYPELLERLGVRPDIGSAASLPADPDPNPAQESANPARLHSGQANLPDYTGE